MPRRSLVCVAGIALAAAACGEAPRSADRNDTPPASVSQEATGTSGPDAQEQAAPVDVTAAQDRQNQVELPATASPLALTGLAGLLSLGGAAGAHLLRRSRQRATKQERA